MIHHTEILVDMSSVVCSDLYVAYKDRSALMCGTCMHSLSLSRLVFGSSTIDSSTRDSAIIFALQLLIASHKQLGGFWGAEPLTI